MLFGTLAVSLLGVAVASVATAAWFAITKPGQTPSGQTIVQSDSSELTIDSITGYKATYDEAGYGITDYTNGHVTPFNYYTKDGATVDDHVNLNQGGVTSYDLPSDGIGYYIVGDSTWCATHNFSEEDAWKYTASLRMDEDPIYGNLGIAKNIYLAAGTQFKLRHHYINNSNYTTDDWIGTLDTNSATTDNAQTAGGNVEIKTGRSGYYNIYYTNSGKISLYLINLYNPAARSKKVNNVDTSTSRLSHIKTRSITSGLRVYLNTTSFTSWEGNSARFAICVQKDGSGDQWASMAQIKSHYYTCIVPSGDWNKIIFCRMDGGNGTNSWSNKWNSCYMTDLGSDNCCKVTGWDDSCTRESFDLAGSCSFSVVGTMNNENWGTDHAMTEGTNAYIYMNFSSSNVELKVRFDNAWTASYGYSNFDSSNSDGSSYSDSGGNIKVASSGKYKIEFDYTSFKVKITSANYRVAVWTSTGSDVTSTAMTMSNSTGSFTINNVNIKATQKAKVVRVNNNNATINNYYGYNNATLNDGIIGYLYDSGSSDGNDHDLKANYEGNYSFTFDGEAKTMTVNGSLVDPAAATPVTYYLESSVSSWNVSARYAVFVIYTDAGDATATRAKWYDMTSVYTNVYSVTVSVAHTKMYFVRMNNGAGHSANNWSNKWNQTVELNKPAAPKNYFFINSGSSDSYNGTWNNFYGAPDPDENGMYLVGTRAFTGSNGVEWSFTAGLKMEAIPVGQQVGQYTGIAYKYENLTLMQGMEFKIWAYNTTSGRGNEYDGDDLLTSDPETTSIAKSNGDSNVEIKNVTGSKFAIYLTTTNKIQIVDNDRSTNIIFADELAEHEMSVFKMGYGDGPRIAIYELGISVTEADITAGRAEFAIRHRAGGAYHWYYYGDGYGSNHGTDSSSSESYIQTGTSRTYGETGAQTTCTGFKFREAGSYKIYLLKNNSSTYEYTVSITQSPGPYGEGYYIVPYNNGWGSSIDGKYNGGVKMKTIEVANSDVQNNLAMYTCYSAKKDDQIIFNYYINGRENYNFHKDPAASQRIVSLATDENTVAAIQTTATSGVFKFKKTGSYNIFVYKDTSDSNNYKIAVAEYLVSDFFSLNPIAKNATSVKDANTSMVLEIDYTTTNSGYNVNTLLDMITPGTGLSQYISFTYVVDPDLGVYTGYDYMRLNTQYSTLLPANVANNRKQTSSVVQASGSHKMFILIDYNQSAISSLPNNPTADFYFVMRLKQVTGA